MIDRCARVLVVDDEPTLVRLCADLLAEAGYQVEMAYGGQQALERLAQEQFDLLLLDIKMPGVDGLTVLRRARESHPNTTAIIMTSYATQENILEATQDGAGGFLAKPFDPEELLQAVKTLLSSRQLQTAIASATLKTTDCAG